MRRFFCGMLLLLVLGTLPARAEFTHSGHVREDLPLLTITVTDTGESTGNDRRPCLLAAEITTADGSLRQTIRWESAENPAFDQAAAMAMLVDYNFDGFKDLQLLTAAGARNVFYAVALWDEEKGCFREV